MSRSSSASAAVRQRGYVRPQGVTFAPSAGNRDSVLSLGSIAHLQYYFARTGLLDGKGAQLAKDDRGKPGVGRFGRRDSSASVTSHDGCFGSGTIVDDSISGSIHIEEPVMLPPTVSTYSDRTPYLPPPPNPESLRVDLATSLGDAKEALYHLSPSQADDVQRSGVKADDAQNDTTENHHAGQETSSPVQMGQPSSWDEIQGFNILDMVTLAIRSAKTYYTSHEYPLRLYSIKSERQIREELLAVMDVLKKMASRNFAGGIRADEVNTIIHWVEGIEALLLRERAIEVQEAEERASWTWLDGDWEGREREREHAFLTYFNPGPTLPPWTVIDHDNPHPTTFVDSLKNGLQLIHLHNALLKKSKRQFGDIPTFHTDLSKPYRCAENLRYWIKAAELRWETKLKVNVSGVVNGKVECYPDFDAAVLLWSQRVRSELSKEWKEAECKRDSTPAYPSPT